MTKRWILIYALVILAGTAAWAFSNREEIVKEVGETKNEIETNYQNSHPPKEEIVTPEYVLLNVPFLSQAPTANWSDPRQQDGCEEASILMAHLWLTNKTMTVKEAEDEIIALSEYQKEKYGEFVDRSMTDTGKLFEEYYKHSNYEIRRNITAQDIKEELAQGNIVIVPTNGQILDNPNYTPPGPLTHMLPIIGYDDKTGEFITNDPGTRNGRQFRFEYQHMIDSIYDYKTGAHEGYEKTETIMMVVKKSS